MVDTVIQSDAFSLSDVQCAISRGLVWTSPSVAYHVFKFSGVTDFLRVSKSTDSGATFGAGDLDLYSDDDHRGHDCWYDKWTNGDTGGIIHYVWMESDNDEIHYRNVDTSDDSLSADKVVQATGITLSNGWEASIISLTKARGGNLYIAIWEDNAGGHSFWRSTDGGVTWTERTSMADGNEVDQIQLLPANAADGNDIWCVYLDRSAGELSIKTYDDSANSWSEVSCDASVTAGTLRINFDAVVRHSDDLLLVAYWNDEDAATADLRCGTFDGTTWTQKTNLLNNSAESSNVAMLFNQQNDDVYVAYLIGSALPNAQAVKYQLSTDDMATWGGEADYSAVSDDHRLVYAGHSVDDAGGRFMPVWYDDDQTEWAINLDNDIEIAAAAGGVDQEVLHRPKLIESLVRGHLVS